MGAWGSGFFEDDTTCDYFDEAIGSDDPVQFFVDSFKKALESEYLEYDEGAAALVSSVMIDAILNGTKFPDETEEFREFIDSNAALSVQQLKGDAVQALNKLLSGSSELNELWAENKEEYPMWRSGIEKLINRL